MKYRSTRKYRTILALVAGLILSLSSCMDLNKDAIVKVVDPIRHYYPIIQGQELDIIYEIKNIGNVPLQITEIQPSCGCIIVDDVKKLIESGESLFLRMSYNSNKNIGLVNHQIYVYGNISGVKKPLPLELNFDVHVVPDALYTRDYEELYKEDIEKRTIEESVDGDGKGKGYYISLDEK